MTYQLTSEERDAILALIRTILNDQWSDAPLDTKDLVRQADAINQFIS